MALTYSIIIPHKDIPGLLQRCLDSIPLREDVEVIVVDDNSDPRKVDFEHFPGLERKNTRVYFTKEGKGAGYARNVGLDHAQGRWVVFADADDFFTEDFGTILDEMVDAEADVVFFDYINVLSDDIAHQVEDRIWHSKIIKDYLNGDKSEFDLRIGFVVPWCKFIKRELVAQHHIRFDEVKWGEDVFFSTQVGCFARSIMVSGKIGYVVTSRKGSITFNIFSTAKEYRVRLTEYMKCDELLAQNGITSDKRLRTKGALWLAYRKQGFWRVAWYGVANVFYPQVFMQTANFLYKKIKDDWKLQIRRLKNLLTQRVWGASISSLRIRQGKSIDMRIELGENIPKVANVIIKAVIGEGKKETIPIPFQEHRNTNRHYLTVSIKPNDFARHYARWNLCVVKKSSDGSGKKSFSVKTKRRIKLKLMLHRMFYRLEDGSSYVTHISPYWHSLHFIRRELSKYENPLLRIREVVACVVYYFARSYWQRRKLILIFDRSARAQDNAEYLFSYIMQNASDDVRKRVFFVIDKNCPDYQRVACFEKNVIPFMSLKHFVYMQAARCFIGSHPCHHLYIKDAMPSLVTRDLYKKPLFNLQHGVIALKNVANSLNASRFPKGCKLLVSSEWEQSIVCDHFGWDAKDVPVLGLARWDALKDKAGVASPLVLYMPTFRDWLQNETAEQFAKSEFARAILSLLHSRQLQKILAKNNATLKLYIHPFMQERMYLLEQDIPNVEFVREGKRPLNELIMECSCVITDYSSICWDAFFIEKPVVFYQFDQERYLTETRSFLDFNQLPGALCFSEAVALNALESSLTKSCKNDTNDVPNASHWFKYHDHNNCQRIFAYLKQEGWF